MTSLIWNLLERLDMPGRPLDCNNDNCQMNRNIQDMFAASAQVAVA